jgi:uncharacterized integral membrane protein
VLAVLALLLILVLALQQVVAIQFYLPHHQAHLQVILLL